MKNVENFLFFLNIWICTQITQILAGDHKKSKVNFFFQT